MSVNQPCLHTCPRRTCDSEKLRLLDHAKSARCHPCCDLSCIQFAAVREANPTYVSLLYAEDCTLNVLLIDANIDGLSEDIDQPQDIATLETYQHAVHVSTKERYEALIGLHQRAELGGIDVSATFFELKGEVGNRKRGVLYGVRTQVSIYRAYRISSH